MQLMRWASPLLRASAGSSNAARIAMMAMTTSNSIKVKALNLRVLMVSEDLAWLKLCFDPASPHHAPTAFGFKETESRRKQQQPTEPPNALPKRRSRANCEDDTGNASGDAPFAINVRLQRHELKYYTRTVGCAITR